MQILHRIVFIFSLSLLAVHASAENRVCIGGDLDHLTDQQKSSCWDSAHQVGFEAAKLHSPVDWHFFVICTDSDWRDYAALSKRSAADLASMSADTDLQTRTTFFRGEWLARAGSAGLDKTVAREVASAVLQTTDEAALQTQVATWLPETSKTPVTLQASR